MTHPFPTGVICHIPASNANDGIHVETCGPDHYVVMVSDVKIGSQVISISRRDAAILVKDWMAHIDIMDLMDSAVDDGGEVECREEDE